MKDIYITYREPNENDELCFYILQRAFPHCISIICTYPKEKALAYSAIAGYNLWVVFDSTLRGAMIPGYKDIINEIQGVMDNMAEWYLKERILKDMKRYSKFKIISNANSSNK